MKNKSAFLSLVVLCAAPLLLSCSKNTDTPASQPSNNAAFNAVGTWSISSYSQRAEDKTSLFKDYVFVFSTGGTLKASKNGDITSGTWVYTPSSVGYYGSTPSKASLTINLGASIPLSRLNKTWNIDSVKTNSTVLSLISPEPTEQETVNFSKQ